MTENTNTPANEQETETNALADEQAMEKFQGLSTRDGEPITPAEKPADKAAKGGEAKAKDGQPKDGEEGEEDEETKRHKSAQDRINKAVGKQRAAERELMSVKERLAALEGRAAGSTQAQPAKVKTGEPDPNDYEYGELDKKYMSDLVDYRVSQKLEESQSKSKKEQDTASKTKAQQEFQEKLDGFLTRGLDIADDFDEVVRDNDFRISQPLAELAVESDHGPEILYRAGSDPKEAKRISAMSPVRQAAWFGQKEAELSSESSDAEEDNEPGETGNSRTNASPKTTKAPPPPKGKTRGSGGTQQVSPATTDFSQFERLATQKQE